MKEGGLLLWMLQSKTQGLIFKSDAADSFEPTKGDQLGTSRPDLWHIKLGMFESVGSYKLPSFLRKCF